MAIRAKEIGWSNEAKLLHEILKSIDRIEKLLRTTTTTTTAAPTTTTTTTASPTTTTTTTLI
jgi:hypothetical protein